MSVKVIQGDCTEVLPQLAADGALVDAVCCDPPYHLASIVKRFSKSARTEATVGNHAYGRHASGFMGKKWDGGDIAFRPETWSLVLDVMKPGAYALVFSGSRTFHRTGVALEDAGFILHPFIAWVFGSGFPKATKVKAEGYDGWRYGAQSLKPAIEPILMAQKPFSEKNGTANVLKHGTGAINIADCRIGSAKRVPGGISKEKPKAQVYGRYGVETGEEDGHNPNIGRWPANLILDGSEEVLEAFAQYAAPGQLRPVSGDERAHRTVHAYGEFGRSDEGMEPRGDAGSPARFFYSAKADAADRLGSKHPTVKPVDLIAYLCRLITPPGGTVLDCFAGSGTTGMACMREGFDCILIEREAEYVADIKRRLKHVKGEDSPLWQAAEGAP